MIKTIHPTKKYGFLLLTCLISNLWILPLFSTENFYNVCEFGATGKGDTYDTNAVQTAIDQAIENGGGTVFFPAGKYLLKTIFLGDNITLFLETGAIILGSTDRNSYNPENGAFLDSSGKKFGSALIFARDKQNIVIKGNGIIDGQGYTEYFPKQKGLSRPSIIRFIRCNNVRIQDITLTNSAAWVQHYVECEDLMIQGITVTSFSNNNNDGLDIDGCQRVIIRGCSINSEDDSIVLKSLSNKGCRDIVISDCMVSGLKSAIKTGTESLGGFENITITNCTFYGTRGISLLSVDGGNLNNITISNISMRDSYAVIVMRHGERMRDYGIEKDQRPSEPGIFKNIMISNIQAIRVTESNDFICGIKGYPIENVTLNNIRIQYAGGGKVSDTNRAIPELDDDYPKAKMFGVLPAYGFFIRHAKNIKLHDIELSYENEEYRSVLLCEDVDQLELDNIYGQSNKDAAPFILLKNTSNVSVKDCYPRPGTDTFMKVTGEGSRNIALYDSSMINALKIVDADDVSADQIKLY